MSNVLEVLTIGGTSPTTDGITQTSRNNEVPAIKRKTTDLMFDHALFGVSVTHIDVPTTQRWAVEVYTNITGADLLIAGVTGIGTTTSAVIPVNGATQNWIGVPVPTSVDIVGSSTAVGTTFGCVVTLSLHN